MSPKTESFPAMGSDGKQYEIFCVRKEIPQSGGRQDLPEYRLGSEFGERLNVKDDTHNIFVALDKRLTLTRVE